MPAPIKQTMETNIAVRIEHLDAALVCDRKTRLCTRAHLGTVPCKDRP